MLRTLIYVTVGSGLLLVLGALVALLYGYLRPEKFRTNGDRRDMPHYGPVDKARTAVLIASRDGSATIATAVAKARANGVDVYVVSDASSDDTAEQATGAGATVLELTENVGKPRALFTAYDHFKLGRRYGAVAILDDDVMIDDDFIEQSLAELDDDTAIVVGRNITWWPKKRRWNVWLANRAYSYWNYQVTIRRLQSFFNVMNCISGSNSLYRTQMLDKVLPQEPPYIVDDTYWVLETHRRKLGRVVYAAKARAYLQDPTNFHDWYKQNLRWLWGTFQGIIGHRVGVESSKFDYAYVLLILHWFLYIVGGPLTLYLLATSSIGLGGSLLILGGLQLVWITAAAIRLRHPKLVLFLPAIIVTDLVYRVIMVHALVKAIREPTVESCKWSSPSRIKVGADDAVTSPSPVTSPVTSPVISPSPVAAGGSTAGSRPQPSPAPAFQQRGGDDLATMSSAERR